MKKFALFLSMMIFVSYCTPLSVGALVSKPGDWFVITTQDNEYYETGVWATSETVRGYNGAPTRYQSDRVGSCSFKPQMPQGTYKVYVYKTVHPNSLSDQLYEINHKGKLDYAVVDYTKGESDWTQLGIFDFWGDGEEDITVNRSKKGDGLKVTRANALKFELVRLADDPIPSVKPSATPGPLPMHEQEEEQEEEVVSDVVAPEKVGDVMIILGTDPLFCSQKGSWAVSANPALSYNGQGGNYLSTPGSVTYTPYMPAGKYRVSTYKTVHENSLSDQKYEIFHMGQADVKAIDFTTGEKGWEELGIYEFWGNGYDYIKAVKADGGQIPLRNYAMKFELLELSKTPAPPGKAKPESANQRIIMDIAQMPIEGEGVLVVIDGVLQQYDQPAVITDGRTLVPLRGIFEALGADVSWEEKSQSITAVKEKTTVKLQIENKKAKINEKECTLDVPPLLLNERTLVPARFVSEALGADVEWIEENQMVKITTQEVKPQSIFVTPKNFSQMGTWQTASYIGAFNDSNLIGRTDLSGKAEPAVAKVRIYEEGDYQIFVHARDFSANKQGERFFEMELNGQRVPKLFGQHALEGFRWEQIGPIHLKQGMLEIALIDSSTFYARCDGIFITKDLKLKEPPKTFEEVVALADVFATPYDRDVFYPIWARSDKAPSGSVSISSDQVKLTFFEVPSEKGNVIQKQMEIKTDQGFEITSSRENVMGTLLMHAMEGFSKDNAGQFPLYEAKFVQKGTIASVKESDIYKIGSPSWLIPSRMEKADENKVLLFAENNVAEAVYKIELMEGEKEPLVTFTLTPKVDGVFTANIWSGSESKENEFSYVFAPFRFNGTILPFESVLVTEPYATVPMALKTAVNKENKTVTTGVMVEPESILKRWPKKENAEFGFSIRGPEGGALPSLAAPLYTSEKAKMSAGDEYTIKYRMIEHFGQWYDVYEHAALDIYKLTDYRKNYFATLNEAIFNTTRLAAGSESGWDENMKGYYNIEYENMVTQSNPLVFLSTYLMTEDEKFLEERAIPTLAYLLSRPGFHYANGDQKEPQLGQTSIGTPCRNYGSAVYGGAYTMTQGFSDVFKSIGIDNGLKSADSYGSTPLCQEYVWLYQYTKDPKYLELAKTEADIFIKTRIDAPRKTRFDEVMFIAIDFYPQFQALIDLYEVTHEQKYIDAAVRGARNLLPTVWIYPGASDESYTVLADYLKENHYAKGYKSFWYGKKVNRVGYPDQMDDLSDLNLPFWVVSRTGLSLEQIFTYTMHDSGNIIMANWAPDLLRLSKYSGEKIFETYARNAVIGRHETYSGYYYNNYFAYQQDKNYPANGPDLTGLYWHHIQPFLAMLQDFLFTQAWLWSDANIDFPSVRNMGYAYFSNRMYGAEPGTFYREKDMWLWLNEGLVETDNIQIDWIAARKEGVAAFAFMNEDETEQTVQISFGNEITGGEKFQQEATIYSADGKTKDAVISQGKLSITVPGRSLVAVTVKAPAVKAPAFAGVDKNKVQGLQQGKQIAEPKSGETDKGYLLQVTPKNYFAYIYITETLLQASGAVLHYKIDDGSWQSISDDYAPFEFIVKVDDPQAEITYYVEKNVKGEIIRSSEKKLTPKTK